MKDEKISKQQIPDNQLLIKQYYFHAELKLCNP
jgi:hypothetical protein